MTAISFIPVTWAVARDYPGLPNYDIVCAMVTDDIIVTIIEPLNSVIPYQPLRFFKHLVMNITTAHSVQNPP